MKKSIKTHSLIFKGVILCLVFLAFSMEGPLDVKAISCIQDSDCGKDYWERQFCQGSSIYGVYVNWTCNKAGTTIGACTLTKTDKQLTSCSSGQTCQEINARATCVGETSGTSSGTGTGTSSGTTCIFYSYQKCSGNSVYWYDSCNNRQDVYQTCSSGQVCYGNSCIVDYVQPTYSQPTYVSHVIQGCVGNISYWYDSLGNQQDAYQNCSLTGQTCQDGQCVGQRYAISIPVSIYASTYVAHSTIKCIGNSVYWYDSKEVKQDVYQDCSLTGQTCQDEKCSGPIVCQPSDYFLHSTIGCYDNNIYWFDSKNEVKDLFKSCADDNQCTKDNCNAEECKNELLCDGSTCFLGSPDYVKYCASLAAVSENSLMSFFKKWYIWIILVVILTFLFVIILRRLSTKV